MHKKMPATTWLAWVHVFNYFICLLDRGASKLAVFFCVSETIKTKKKYYDLNTHKPQVSEN